LFAVYVVLATVPSTRFDYRCVAPTEHWLPLLLRFRSHSVYVCSPRASHVLLALLHRSHYRCYLADCHFVADYAEFTFTTTLPVTTAFYLLRTFTRAVLPRLLPYLYRYTFRCALRVAFLPGLRDAFCVSPVLPLFVCRRFVTLPLRTVTACLPLRLPRLRLIADYVRLRCLPPYAYCCYDRVTTGWLLRFTLRLVCRTLPRSLRLRPALRYTPPFCLIYVPGYCRVGIFAVLHRLLRVCSCYHTLPRYVTFICSRYRLIYAFVR